MSIELIIGPMFSGKTTELVRRIRRHTLTSRECIILKYNKDTRYHEKHIATHDKVFYEALSCSSLRSSGSYSDVDIIGIDEGQFFDDLVEFAEEMANSGKIVIIAALDGTFQRKPFGSILELIPKSERIDKLTAICMGKDCTNDASFSKRITNETDIEVIGGSDKYIAVCRSCFQKSY